MDDQRNSIIKNALNLAKETKSHRVFIFLNTNKELSWFLKSDFVNYDDIVLIVPKTINIPEYKSKDINIKIIKSWAGNQSRFSRIKYAFLHGVLQKLYTLTVRLFVY